MISVTFSGLDTEHHTRKNTDNQLCSGNIIEVPLQNLRNMRHKDKCIEENGIIGKCEICKATFTSSELVNNFLNQNKQNASDLYLRRLGIPMEYMKDIYAMRYPYDIMKQEIKESFIDSKILNCIVKDRFNNHDVMHRSSCFKKGNECRYHLPMPITNETSISFGSIESKWSTIAGSDINATSYDVVIRRKMGDQFMNTFSPSISGVFGYNSNIQIGDICDLYCTTL